MSIRYHKPVTDPSGRIFVYRRDLFTPLVAGVPILLVAALCVGWLLQDFGVIR